MTSGNVPVGYHVDHTFQLETRSKMLLLLFAVIGLRNRKPPGMSVRGFVVLAMISITASVDRTWMTLLQCLWAPSLLRE